MATANGFSLGQLAAGMAIGPDHLSKLFKIQTGRSPQDYFQTRRLLAACASLLDCAKSVTELSLDFGFADPSHFGRLFRRYHGLTPREYRKRYTHERGRLEVRLGGVKSKHPSHSK